MQTRTREIVRALRTGVAATLGVALALGAGCRPQEAKAADHPPLRIGLDLWAGYYPLVIADELGYLRAEGVEVEISWPEDTDRLIASFAARELDAIAVSLGDVVTSTRIAPDVRMVLTSDESAGADVILGRGPLEGAASIRGRRIGTNLGGFGEILVREFLARHGVAISEVTLVNIDAAGVPSALASGELDIGHTWEPYATQAREGGAVPWFTSAETPGLILDGLMMHASTLAERGAECRAMARAWFRAVDWWQANFDDGARLVERRLGLPAGSVNLDGIDLKNAADNRALLRGDGGAPVAETAAATLVDFFVANGSLTDRPEPAALIDDAIVP